MMPPAAITTLEVGLACSARWLAMKALVFTASWFKEAHRIKSSPALTPFWLSSREKHDWLIGTGGWDCKLRWPWRAVPHMASQNR